MMGNETSRFPAARTALNAAFRDMRKAGAFAKQRYKCCSSCACAAAQAEAGARVDFVYYHAQDAEVLSRGRHCRGGDALMIRFGVLDPGGERTATQVAKMALGALRARGVVAKWNGDEGLCIVVDLSATEEGKNDG